MPTFLDEATVENILSFRPVYLAILGEHYYEYTSHEILTVDFDFDTAAVQAIEAGLNSFEDKDYMPTNRWFLQERDGFRERHISWRDGWQASKMQSCTVQKWLPGRGQIEVHFFVFDAWFKQQIIAEKLSFDQIVQKLESWRKHPDQLLGQMQTSYERFQKVDDRQAWVEHYGSEAPGWMGTVDPDLAPVNTWDVNKVPFSTF